MKPDWAPGGHRIAIIPYADHPRGLSTSGGDDPARWLPICGYSRGLV